MAKYIVTIAPPTPNGDLHLGHISGPYMAADVFTRLRRQLGDEVVFVSYSDDYQSYVARKARELDADPKKLATENGRKILESMTLLDIDIDHFQQAGQNRFYLDAVQMFYDGYARSNDTGSRKQKIPYFPQYDVYGYEAYARGTCNICGESTDASQCENCATSPVLEKMSDIRCTLDSDATVEWREVARQFLKIGNRVDFLRNLYVGKNIRPSLRKFIDRIIDSEHDDWFINRPGECGAPVRDVYGQLTPIHTWFSGMAGYYASVAEFAALQGKPELKEYYWNDAETSIAMFVGYDCSFSHAVVYPILLSCQEGLTQSFNIYTNHFLKLNDEDFSTSRGHAIWARDMASQFDVNAIRLYLASVAPEQAIANFRQTDFELFNKRYFTDGLLPLLEKVTSTASHNTRLLEQHPQVAVIANRWCQLTDPDSFSMRMLAGVAIDLLNYILASTVEDTRHKTILLALYGYLARAIHPSLSDKISALTGIDDRMIEGVIEHCRTETDAPAEQFA